MITVARVYKIDGMDTQFSAEGGSASEALAEVIAAAEEVGAAPRASTIEPAGTAAGGADKRKRRTKAEIEADAAKEAAAAAPPAFSAPPSLPPVTHAFSPPPATAGAPVVEFSNAPPVPQGQFSVTISAPPPPEPPTFTQEELLRMEIEQRFTNLIKSIPEAWVLAAKTNVEAWIVQSGGLPDGDVSTLTAEQCEVVIKKIVSYQAVCDRAPR